MDNQFRITQVLQKFVHNVDETRFVSQERVVDAMHFGSPRINITIRLKILMVIIPGQSSIEEFDAPDFNHAVTLSKFQPRGFSVQNDLPHCLWSQFIDGAIGQSIRLLIFRMTTVSFHPVPLDIVALRDVVQSLPEVYILHGFVTGGLPATALPVG